MQEFIQKAAAQLGVDGTTVSSAIGTILDLIKEHMPGTDFQALLAKIPGAGALLGQAGGADEGGSGGGLLGGIGDGLGGLMGGSGGSALGSLAKLQETGLDTGQIGSLLGMFKDHASEQAGSDLADKAFGSVPGLGNLLR